MNTVKTNGKAFFAAIAFTLAFLGGCSNFMSNESDFKSRLKDDVSVANAPKVNLRIQAVNNEGVTSPNGYSTQKVGVPFALIYSASDSYGLVNWAAFDRDDMTPLTGVVSFAKEKEYETTATVLLQRDDILIQPVTTTRPMVKTTRPRNGDTPVRNTSIKIYFTKPIAASSFKFADDAWIDSQGNFKNITIKGLNGDPGLQDYVSKTEFFLHPVLSIDGKMLTITPDTNKGYLPAFTDMQITISKAIADETGYTMPNDYVLEYTLSDNMDSQPPVISLITGGLDSAASSYVALNNASHRVGSGSLYLAVTASDSATGGGAITAINLFETRKYDSSGTAVTDSKRTTAITQNVVVNGEVHTFPYQLLTGADGIYELAVIVKDSNENWIPDANATKYVVIRDTKAPDAAANAANIAPGGATAAGFFNGESNTSIVFKDTGNKIVDFGYTTTPSAQGRTWSNDVYWSFRLGETGTWSEYKSTKDSLTLAIPASVADGLVPVYVRFRDDLANESAIAPLSSVYKDAAKPTGSVTVKNTTSIAAGGVTYEMIGSSTLSVEVTGADTVTGSYAGSGIAYYFVSADQDATIAASDWKPYLTSGVNATTCAVDPSDGEKAVYVWFKDRADNVSTPIKSTQRLLLDNTDPVIKSLYFKTSSFSGTADPANPGDVYAKDVVIPFAFTATEEGAGIGTFAIKAATDTAYTAWFDALSDSDQTSGSYAVKVTSRYYAPTLHLWIVTGNLKVPATNGKREFVLKARDRVRLTSSSVPFSTHNRVVFDDVNPIVSAVSVQSTATGYFLKAGAIYVSSLSPTIVFTAKDPTTASTIVSGLRDYDITSAAGILENSISAIPFPSNAAETLLNRIAQTQVVSLAGGADGQKLIKITARDWALNAGEASFSFFLDRVAPSASMQLYGSGVKLSEDTTALAHTGDATNYRNASTFSVYLSATDPDLSSGVAGSGVMPGASHALSLHFAGTKVTDTTGYSGYVSNVSANGLYGTSGASPSATITLPEDGVLHIPLSGLYEVSIVAQDNVNNKTAADGLRAGFYYDGYDPALGTTPVVVNSSGSAIGAVYGTTLFVNEENVFFKTAATDKPSEDPNGSGLAFAELVYDDFDGSATQTPTVVKTAVTENSSSDPATRFIWNGVNSASRTGVSGLTALQLVSGHKYTVKTRFTDAAGNDAETGTVVVSYDNDDPTATVSARLEPPVPGEIIHHGKRFGRTPTLDATASDGVNGSGIQYWLLDSSSASVADPLLWKNYSAASFQTALRTAFTALCAEGTPVKAYLHLKDYAGNEIYRDLDDSNFFVLDTTPPSVDEFKIAQTSATPIPFTSGVTSSKAVTLTLTITGEKASGIKKLVFTGPIEITAVTSPSNAANPSSVDASEKKTVTFTDKDFLPSGDSVTVTLTANLIGSDEGKTIEVVAEDALGNKKALAKNAIIMLDTAPPSFVKLQWSTPTSPSYLVGDSLYTKTAAASFVYDVHDDTSGLNKIDFTGDINLPVTDTLGATLGGTKDIAEETKSITLNTTANGKKTITAKVWDFAGLSFEKNLVAYFDNTPPEFTAVLSDSTGTTIMATKATGSSKILSAAQSSTFRSTNPVRLVITGDDGTTGAGIKDGSSHPYTLYRTCYNDDESLPDASTWTAVDTGYFANSSIQSFNFTSLQASSGGAYKGTSGVYIWDAKMLDKLDNAKLVDGLDRIGFLYDATPPVIESIGAYVNTGSGPSFATSEAVLKGSTYWISGQKIDSYSTGISGRPLYIRLNATDRPTDDPHGSGLGEYALTMQVTRNFKNTSASSATVNFTPDHLGSAWIDIDNAGVDYFTTADLASLVLKVMKLKDVVGNESASTPTYTLVVDGGAPVASIAFTGNATTGYASGVTYLNGSSFTANLTSISDPVETGSVASVPASGVKAWAISTQAAMNPSTIPAYSEVAGSAEKAAWDAWKAVAAAGDRWNFYDNSASINVKPIIQSLLGNDSEPKALYLYVVDYAGNVNVAPLGSYMIDTKAPTITLDTGFVGPKVYKGDSDKPAFYDGSGVWYTNDTTINIRADVSDFPSAAAYASGLSLVQIHLGYNGGEDMLRTNAPIASTDEAGKTIKISNPAETDGNWKNMHTLDTFRVTARFSDVVGNAALSDPNFEHPLFSTTCAVIYDGAMPIVSSAPTFGNVAERDGTRYYGTTAPTISFAAKDQKSATPSSASGLAAWYVGTSVNGATATSFATALSTTDVAEGSVSAGTLPSVSGTALYLYLMDKAGNFTGTHATDNPGYSLGSFVEDVQGATISSCAIGSTDGIITASSSNSAVIQFEESGSGLKKLVLSGMTNADLTGMGFTWSADATFDASDTTITGATFGYAPGSLTVTLPSSYPSGYIRITGLGFDGAPTNPSSVDGPCALTVTVVDALANTVATGHTMTSDSVTLDTVRPVVSAWIKRTDSKGASNATAEASDEYTTNASVDLHVKFTETGTGLASLSFSGGGFASLTANEVWVDGTKLTSGTDYTVHTSALTFTPAKVSAETGTEIVIKEFSVDIDANGTNVVTITPSDKSDGTATNAYIIYDAAPPIVTASNLATVYFNSGNSKYYVHPSNNLTATFDATGYTYFLVNTTATATYTAIRAGTPDTDGSESVSKVSSDWFNATTALTLYAHLTDAAGNIVHRNLYGHAVLIDDAGPTGSGAGATISVSTSPTASGNYFNFYRQTVSSTPTYYTKAASIALSFTGCATDPDSGFAGYGKATDTAGVTSVPLPVGSAYTIRSFDNVGNKSATSFSLAVVDDSDAPSIGTITVTGDAVDGTGTTVKLTATVEETKSGLREITLGATDGTVDATSAIVMIDGTSVGKTVSSDHKNIIVITDPLVCAANTSLEISGIKLTSTIDNYVTILLADALGNAASTASSTSLDLPTASIGALSVTPSGGHLNDGKLWIGKDGSVIVTPSSTGIAYTITAVTSTNELTGSFVGVTAQAIPLPTLAGDSSVRLSCTAGSNSWTGALGLGATLYTDETTPTGSITVSTTPTASGNYFNFYARSVSSVTTYFTKAATLSLSFSGASDSDSGFAGYGLATDTTGVNPVVLTAGASSATVHTVHAFNNVGMKSTFSRNVPVVQDVSGPTLGAITVAGSVATDGKVTASISGTIEETGSGLRTITLTSDTGTVDATGATVTIGGAVIPRSVSTTVKNVIVITTPLECAAGTSLVIEKLALSATGDNGLTATPADALGNDGNAENDAFTVPTVVSFAYKSVSPTTPYVNSTAKTIVMKALTLAIKTSVIDDYAITTTTAVPTVASEWKTFTDGDSDPNTCTFDAVLSSIKNASALYLHIRDSSGTVVTYATSVTPANQNAGYAGYAWYTDNTAPVKTSADWRIGDTDVKSAAGFTVASVGSYKGVSSHNYTNLEDNGLTSASINVVDLFTETADLAASIDTGPIEYAIDTSASAIPPTWYPSTAVYFPLGNSNSASDAKTFYLYAKDKMGNISTTCLTDNRGNYWILDNTAPGYTSGSKNAWNDGFGAQSFSDVLSGLDDAASGSSVTTTTSGASPSITQRGSYTQISFTPGTNTAITFTLTYKDKVGNSRQFTINWTKTGSAEPYNYTVSLVSPVSPSYGAGTFFSAIGHGAEQITNSVFDGTLYAATADDLLRSMANGSKATVTTDDRVVPITKDDMASDQVPAISLSSLLERHARAVDSAGSKASMVSERALTANPRQRTVESGRAMDSQAVINVITPLANAFMQKRGVIFKAGPRQPTFSRSCLKVQELAQNVLKTDIWEYRTFIFRKMSIV